jgi:hypothetical protein
MNTRVPINTTYPSLPSMPGTDAGGMPGPHSAMHKHGGADEVATATPAANQIPKAGGDGKIAAGWLPSTIARLVDLTWGAIIGKPATGAVGWAILSCETQAEARDAIGADVFVTAPTHAADLTGLPGGAAPALGKFYIAIGASGIWTIRHPETAWQFTDRSLFSI